MKKLISLMLGALMSLSLAACQNSGSPSAQMPNPFTDHATMKEAEKAAGFDLSAPEAMEHFSGRVIRTMAGEDTDSMIEVIYCNDDENPETSRDEIRVRKAAGKEDISGDYTNYAENSTVIIDNLPVSVKGENGKIQLATWSRGDYTYSIGFYFDTGISREDLDGFITSIQ